MSSIKAKLIEQTRTGDSIMTELSFDRNPRAGVAPAFLYELDREPGRASVCILEWLVSAGETYQFETRGAPPADLIVGKAYGFQSIWTPLAFDIVADLGARWEERAYPRDGDHDHCPLSHQKLSADGPLTVGYWSPDYGWISRSAYRDEIVGDRYGVRARIGAGRVPIG